MRVKCLAQEHNAVPRPGLEPRPPNPESSALTIRPPCLPSQYNSPLLFTSRSLVYNRWLDNTSYTAKLFFPKPSQRKRDFYFSIFQRGVKAQLNGHGMGRHKKDEVYSIAKKDLQTLSDYLDAKPFVMGQEPTIVDASVFGLLAEFVWQDQQSPQHAAIHSEFRNLIGYCERMKERYWSDWDEAIAQRKKFHSES